MELKHRVEVVQLKGSSFRQGWSPGVLEAHMADGLSLRAAQALALTEGHRLSADLVDNLVVTAGKALVADLIIDGDATGLTYHGIGTVDTSPAGSDTTLTAEVARKAWSTRTRSGADLNLSVFYTAAECTFNIAEAGVFGGATAGTAADSGRMFSHYLQPYDNSGGGVDLTFDYNLTVG